MRRPPARLQCGVPALCRDERLNHPPHRLGQSWEAKETVSMLLNDFEAHSADWLWRTCRPLGRAPTLCRRHRPVGGPARRRKLLALFAPDRPRAGRPCGAEDIRDHVLRIHWRREGWWPLSGLPLRWRLSRRLLHIRGRNAERASPTSPNTTFTDLPNRAMLVRQLEAAREAADKRGASPSLHRSDNFVGQRHARHPAGDAYLKAWRAPARLVGPTFPPRLGGDEFASCSRGHARAQDCDLS